PGHGGPRYRAPGHRRGRRRPRLSPPAVRSPRCRPAAGARREDRPERAQVPRGEVPPGVPVMELRTPFSLSVFEKSTDLELLSTDFGLPLAFCLTAPHSG